MPKPEGEAPAPTAAKKPRKRMGRPPLEIDPVKVRKLASYGLTLVEVAAVLGCSKDVLERRFQAELKEGRERLNGSLKRKQVSLAMKGNVAMLIWLGKQYLGQHEPKTQVEMRTEGGAGVAAELERLGAEVARRKGVGHGGGKGDGGAAA